jgi:hypothetical protein
MCMHKRARARDRDRKRKGFLLIFIVLFAWIVVHEVVSVFFLYLFFFVQLLRT